MASEWVKTLRDRADDAEVEVRKAQRSLRHAEENLRRARAHAETCDRQALEAELREQAARQPHFARPPAPTGDA